MYAIIEDQGRQYTVREGDVLDLDLRDAQEQESIVFDRVLMLGGSQSDSESSDAGGGVQVGAPTVAGAKVRATVLGEAKGNKIVVRKFKRRKNYRRKQGHRQRYTRIRIDAIEG